MKSFEQSLEQKNEGLEIPREIIEFQEMCKNMKEDYPSEAFIVHVEKLGKSLYENDVTFKEMLDEEMKGVTDPEFAHDGPEENKKDHFQALLNALSKYSEKFEQTQ